MFLIGMLFGLGFDTATEVGLLGIVAIEAGKGLPVWAILIFPMLFAVGMSLVDATDGVLMLGAYGWAFLNPARKLYYNLTITTVSIVVAVYVGAVELFSIAGGGRLDGRLARIRDRRILRGRLDPFARRPRAFQRQDTVGGQPGFDVLDVCDSKRIGQRANVRIVADAIARDGEGAKRPAMPVHIATLQP